MFFASQISGPEGTYKVIPSLNGGLFKWDGATLEAVPFTAETLLSTSFKLNDENVMVGGKEIHSFGINARTGEVYQILFFFIRQIKFRCKFITS